MSARLREMTAAALLWAACAAPAVAGSACEEKPMSIEALRDALATGARLQAALNASGRDVALIARQGQDLSSYGLKYSHAGLAYRAGPDQPWRVVELLNDCGTAASALWVDGLANFFLDGPFTYDALVMVPPAPAAERLKLVLRDTAQLHRLHQPHYSMVAYPFATAYQNSNQWVLEVLASAGADPGRVATRQEAQSWLQSSGYQPSEMRIGVFKRLGGRMFKVNVAFDDHPDNLRYAGRINTVTVDSLRDFLRLRHGWSMREISGGR
jgi:hypothetical protein